MSPPARSAQRCPKPLQLLFSRTFRSLVRQLPEARRKRMSALVRYVKRANVVLHATFNEVPRSVHTATLLGCRPMPTRLPKRQKLSMLAANEPLSPFSHLRLHTKRHGKLLIFSTGNVIRAGKYTHGDASWSVLALCRWAMQGDGYHSLLWPTAMSAPNSVCSGQYAQAMPAGIYNHWRATHTSKFPGIAITFANAPGITVELFTKDDKFIVPGVKSAEGLLKAVEGMVDLHCEISGTPST